MGNGVTGGKSRNAVFEIGGTLYFCGFDSLDRWVMLIPIDGSLMIRPATGLDAVPTFELKGHTCGSPQVLDEFARHNAIGCMFSCVEGVYYQTDIDADIDDVDFYERFPAILSAAV